MKKTFSERFDEKYGFMFDRVKQVGGVIVSPIIKDKLGEDIKAFFETEMAEAIFEIKKNIAGASGIIQSNIEDTGQIVLAQNKLGRVIEILNTFLSQEE